MVTVISVTTNDDDNSCDSGDDIDGVEDDCEWRNACLWNDICFVQEARLNDILQSLATHIAPVYQRVAPDSYFNQVGWTRLMLSSKCGNVSRVVFVVIVVIMAVEVE